MAFGPAKKFPSYRAGAVQSQPLGMPPKEDEFTQLMTMLNQQAGPSAIKAPKDRGMFGRFMGVLGGEAYGKEQMGWVERLGRGADGMNAIRDEQRAMKQAQEEEVKRREIAESMGMYDGNADLFAMDPAMAMQAKYRGEDIARDDKRYADETAYREKQWLTDQQRYETEQERLARIETRGNFESDRSFNAQEAARRAENTPRNIWQSAGEGVIFNQATGEYQDVSGGGMAGGLGAPSAEGLSFPDSPFSTLKVYGPQGLTDMPQGIIWRGAGGGGNVEDRRGLMSPNREGNARGDKKMDETVAKEIAAWKTGGRTTAFTNLQRLQSVINDLESGKNISGPVVGNLPAWVQAGVNPQSLQTKAAVDSVIQGSLKAILGGQFTEKEAQGMLERAYNPRLSEAANAANLKVIYNDLVGRSATLEGMANYIDQYGTVQGFQSPTEGVTDFQKNAAGSTVPDGAVKALQANPALRSQFEAKYGPGSASRYLDGMGAN